MSEATRDYIRNVKPQFYLMNANDRRELLHDKSWRGNARLLLCTTRKGREIIIGGFGDFYDKIDAWVPYIYDTGNGLRVPRSGDETLRIDGIIYFDANGEWVDRGVEFDGLNLSEYAFYVMK